MRTQKKTLLDFYSNPFKYGIFYALSKNPKFSELFKKLGLTEDDDIHSIDFDYYYNRSGLKTLSLAVQLIINGYIIEDEGLYVVIKNNDRTQRVTWDYVLQQVDQDIINSIIATKFLRRWEEAADTLYYDYDALNPYSMKVDTTYSDKLDSEGSDSADRNSSATDASSLSSSDGVYGFNSTESSPSDTTSQKGENTSSDESHTSSSNKYERTTAGERNVVRKGNIGNKSSQQLIAEQRELLRYQIFDMIYDDLDSILTLPKYN